MKYIAQSVKRTRCRTLTGTATPSLCHKSGSRSTWGRAGTAGRAGKAGGACVLCSVIKRSHHDVASAVWRSLCRQRPTAANACVKVRSRLELVADREDERDVVARRGCGRLGLIGVE